MDLFKYTSSLGASYFTEGQAINGVDKITWIERYRDPGEFKLVAPLSSGLREFLPIGSYISQMNSTEVMCVENHEVIESVVDEPNITISGRSILATFLEDRVLGADENWGTHAGLILPYTLTSNTSRNQVKTILDDHILTGSTAAGNDFPNIHMAALAKNPAHAADESVARVLKHGPLIDRVNDLLKVDDLGLKVIRRGWYPPGSFTYWNQTNFYVHSGREKTDTVIFSWDADDFQKAEYLFSRKLTKNAALVTGTYAQTAVVPTETGEARRWMYVDASDIDGNLDTIPTGGTLTAVLADMITRGEEALKAQIDVDASQYDLSNLTQWTFRTDYNMGDVVSVEGSFGGREARRVVEHVEIVDEDGTVGIPTFAAFNKYP